MLIELPNDRIVNLAQITRVPELDWHPWAPDKVEDGYRDVCPKLYVWTSDGSNLTFQGPQAFEAREAIRKHLAPTPGAVTEALTGLEDIQRRLDELEQRAESLETQMVREEPGPPPVCGHIEPIIPCYTAPRVESITVEWPGGCETFFAGERAPKQRPAGGVVLPGEDDQGGPVS